MIARALPRRLLGKTGLEVTVPALGGVGLGGKDAGDLYGGISDAEAVTTVHRAIERGINFIDTSPLYCESERRIGLALGELSAEQRGTILLSSKVGDDCPPFSDNGGHSAMSYDGVMSSVDHSLRLLGAAHLDLCLVHDPTYEELDKEFLADGGGMDALRELRRQGVVKHFGIGCLEREQHMRFLEEPDAEVVLAVNDFNLVRRFAERTLFPRTAELDVGVINAGIYYMGLLAAPQTSFQQGFKASLEQPELVSLAQRMETWWAGNYGGVPLRVPALQFGIRHEAVSTTVVGCRTAQEVDQVCDAMLHEIPEEAWERFEAEFGEEVADFKREWHWFYDKTSSDIGGAD